MIIRFKKVENEGKTILIKTFFPLHFKFYSVGKEDIRYKLY